ncbi:hypothetical protein ACQJBY_014337 [Aegilops geniculata]
MAGASGLVAFLLLSSMIVSAAPATLIPRCGESFHSWGEHDSCIPPENDECDSWCKNRCARGACELKQGKHYCHCYKN